MAANPPMSSPNPALAAYYDRLARYTRLARRFGWGGGDDVAAVRHALIGPDGRASPMIALGPVPTVTCAGLVTLLLGIAGLETSLFRGSRAGRRTLTPAPTLPPRTGGGDGVQVR